jgi:hypothetical protein
MKTSFGKPMTTWWMRFVPVVVGVALIGCDGEIPSSPSPSPGAGPQFEAAEQVAAARSVLSVAPKNVHLRCNAGFPCEADVIVSSSSPVSIQYSAEGEFGINFGGTFCSGTLSGSCSIRVEVQSTEIPGRRSGNLLIEDLTNGSTKTVRLSARVI